MAQVEFAAALFRATWALGEVLYRLGTDAWWRPVTRLFPLAATLLWSYAVASVSSAGTWPMHAPAALAAAAGVVLAAGGLLALGVGLRSGFSVMMVVGVVMVMSGVGLVGRSWLAIALSLLFTVLAVRGATLGALDKRPAPRRRASASAEPSRHA